ncbi:hypothetical protein PanWU01x14_193400, partial [Parasponia andersonii]
VADNNLYTCSFCLIGTALYSPYARIIEEYEEPKVVKAEKGSSAFADFDILFADIQYMLEGGTGKSGKFSGFHAISLSVEEIANAKKIFKQCLDVDLANVILFGQDIELKKSRHISMPFPDNMVDEVTKFLANFEQCCDQYQVAQQGLSKAKEKEKLIDELKTTMKLLSSEFLPTRTLAEVVFREIAGLERQLIERKAKKARLRERLEVLADIATTSKQAMLSAVRDMELSAVRKKQAEKVIDEMDKSWESLKVGHSLLLK